MSYVCFDFESGRWQVAFVNFGCTVLNCLVVMTRDVIPVRHVAVRWCQVLSLSGQRNINLYVKIKVVHSMIHLILCHVNMIAKLQRSHYNPLYALIL